MAKYVVCALYRFVRLPHFEALQSPLLQTMKDLRVRGTLLLAEEGINGTIAGSQDGVNGVLTWLMAQPEFADLDVKESYTEEEPFKRTKVKLKKEIVTMGVENIDPNRSVGTYIDPEGWNDLISDPDVLLIDTRNQYEVEVGTFRNAVNPGTDSFREFPTYVEKHLDPKAHKKIAMFCTGGIRCEKSTAYLKERGFEEVYHLKGGILNYLEKTPADKTLWDGECFVFDDRVTVNHSLEPGTYDQCNACRSPITDEDKATEQFVKGVSCPRCVHHTSAERKKRFEERERQVELAKNRGEAHLGDDAAKILGLRRLKKKVSLRAQLFDNHAAEEMT